MTDSPATSWTVAHQATLSVGFHRHEYWSGLPFPSPRDLPDPGIKPISPALAEIVYHWATMETHKSLLVFFILLKPDLNFIDLIFCFVLYFSVSFIYSLFFMISFLLLTLDFIHAFLVVLGVNLNCLFENFLVSWYRLVLL